MSAKTQRTAKTKTKRATSKRRRKTQTADKFCVIGTTAYQRTWFNSEVEAIEHALPMFRRNIDPKANPRRLLVVKVACVLEQDEPVHPPLKVRQSVDSDFEPAQPIPTVTSDTKSDNAEWPLGAPPPTQRPTARW